MDSEVLGVDRINTETIRRYDPEITELIVTVSHAILYTFDVEKSEWVKSDIEGVLFIYQCSNDCRYKMFILNRLHLENFIEPIYSDTEIQLFDSFIVYRSTSELIYGIYFHNKNECEKVKDILRLIPMDIHRYSSNVSPSVIESLKPSSHSKQMKNQSRRNKSRNSAKLLRNLDDDTFAYLYENSPYSVKNIEMNQKLKQTESSVFRQAAKPTDQFFR